MQKENYWMHDQLERRMKMGVASLVLGIISLVWALLAAVFGGTWISALIGVIGIILGAVAKKQAPSGVATAGLVLSIIGTILSLLFVIACVACAGALAAL